jgi:hypothetical protein
VDDQEDVRGKQKDRNEQRSVPIFTAHDEIEAELVKELLQSSGIECVLQGRMAAGVYPGFIGDLGKREILVLEDDAEDAKALLAGWHEKDPGNKESSS